MSCMVSNVGDMWGQRLPEKFPTQPWTQPFPGPLQPLAPAITREEFDALKREVAEMKDMLRRAKAYDKEIGSPNCQIEDKMAMLRKVAEFVGIDLDDVIGAVGAK